MPLISNNTGLQTLDIDSVNTASVATLRQLRDDQITYTLDYRPWIDPADKITDAKFTVLPVTEPGLFVNTIDFKAGNVVQFRITGGSDGARYKVNCQIFLASGQTKNDFFYLNIGPSTLPSYQTGGVFDHVWIGTANGSAPLYAELNDAVFTPDPTTGEGSVRIHYNRRSSADAAGEIYETNGQQKYRTGQFDGNNWVIQFFDGKKWSTSILIPPDGKPDFPEGLSLPPPTYTARGGIFLCDPKPSMGVSGVDNLGYFKYRRFPVAYVQDKAPERDEDSQPITLGSLWLNTTNNLLYYYSENGWENVSRPSPATLTTLSYFAAQNQTDFSLSESDINGNKFALGPTMSLMAFVNGSRLTPDHDFYVHVEENIVSVAQPLPAGATLTLEIAAHVNSDGVPDVTIANTHQYGVVYGNTSTMGGRNNTALGFNAYNQRGEAKGVTAIGVNAGEPFTTGTDLTAVGYNALAGIVEGDGNTAVGAGSLEDLQQGKANTAVGNFAGQHAMDDYGTFVGFESGKMLTRGDRNTFIGAEAGAHISEGTANTIIGSHRGEEGIDNNVILSDGDGNSRLWFNTHGALSTDGLNYGDKGFVLTSQGSGLPPHWTQSEGDGDLKAANNLSDLKDKTIARKNLGLGNAATQDVGSGPGTVAAGNDPRFQNMGDMHAANNLSELTDMAAARHNLELGDSAVLNVGNTAGTVCAGDDPRLNNSHDGKVRSVTGVSPIKVDPVEGDVVVSLEEDPTIKGDLMVEGNIVSNTASTVLTNGPLLYNSQAAGAPMTGVLFAGADSSGIVYKGDPNSPTDEGMILYNVYGTYLGGGHQFAIDGYHVGGFTPDGLNIPQPKGGKSDYWIAAPNTNFGQFTLTLPDNQGADGYALTTDGRGNLRWEQGAGTKVVPASPTTPGIVYGFTTTLSGSNTSFGYKAGADLTNENANVFIGYEAGLYAKGASHNVAVGYLALSQSTSMFNTAVGAFAGEQLNDTTSNNTFIGANSGKSVSTGEGNTFVGGWHGTDGLNRTVALSDGSGNVRFYVNEKGSWSVDGKVFGSVNQVLMSQGENLPPVWSDGSAPPAMPTYKGVLYGFSSEKNVSLGYFAGYYMSSNDSGSGNVAIGFEAGKLWNGANSNVAIGYQAMADSGITGATSNNVAIGSMALRNVTTPNNIAIGNNAFTALTNGIGIAVGLNAGKSVTSAQAVIAIGQDALAATTDVSGTGAVALGWSTFPLATAPVNSLALGYRAGQKQTTGGKNTYVGALAGSEVVTGEKNTILGPYVGTAAMSQTVVLADGDGNARFVADNGGAWSADGKSFGADGQVLVSKGPGLAPAWTDAAGGVVTATPVRRGVMFGYTFEKIYTPVLLGYQAGAALDQTGKTSSVVAIGTRAAMRLTATDLRSTYIGTDTGLSQTSGDNNTFIGKGAGGSTPYAQDSIIIGAEAGNTSYAKAAGDFDRNIFIGNLCAQALKGADNIFIGHSTMRWVGGATTITDSTIVGGFAQNAAPPFDPSGCVVLATPTGKIRQVYNKFGALSLDGQNFNGGIVMGTGPATPPKFATATEATGEQWVNGSLGAGNTIQVVLGTQSASAIIRLVATNRDTGDVGVYMKAIAAVKPLNKTVVTDVMTPLVPSASSPLSFVVDTASGAGITYKLTGPTTGTTDFNMQIIAVGANIMKAEVTHFDALGNKIEAEEVTND